MATDKKQFNVRLSEKSRMTIEKLRRLWDFGNQTKTMEKMISDTWKRETQ